MNKKKTLLIIMVSASILAEIFVKILEVFNKKQKEIDDLKELADKHLVLMQLFNQWIITKQEGKSIAEYFYKNNLRSIAVYGMGAVGERLFQELEETGIEIKYAIDQNRNGIYKNIEVISPDEEMPYADAIIVTPIFYFDEIEKMMSKKAKYKIISLEDILYDI